MRREKKTKKQQHDCISSRKFFPTPKNKRILQIALVPLLPILRDRPNCTKFLLVFCLPENTQYMLVLKYINHTCLKCFQKVT